MAGIDYEERRRRFHEYDPNANGTPNEDPILKQARLFREKKSLEKQYFTGHGPPKEPKKLKE